MNKELLALFFVLFCVGCGQKVGTEKYQKKRDRTVDVHEAVIEIEIGDLLVGANACLYPMNEYILVLDSKSYDNLVHVFDRKSLRYLYSGIKKGRGPGEIVIPGDLMTDETHRRFYIPDHGKRRIYGYDLDRFGAETDCKPVVETKMLKERFPGKSQFIGGDTLIGLVIEPIGNYSFKQAMARWNMTTGKITPMPYEQPDIERRRIAFAASVPHDLYVETYYHHDLMTICSLNGDLKYNIYGPKWDAALSNSILYFDKPLFCRDKILVSYSGGNNDSEERYPTRIMVFDLDGEYIQTLETGYKISDFCYDEERNRLILSLDDEIQFACLDLDGIV